MSTLHVHLDHGNYEEVSVLKEPTGQVAELAQHVMAERGVRHGNVQIIPMESIEHVHEESLVNRSTTLAQCPAGLMTATFNLRRKFEETNFISPCTIQVIACMPAFSIVARRWTSTPSWNDWSLSQIARNLRTQSGRVIPEQRRSLCIEVDSKQAVEIG